jgi:hypothetical protein
MMALNSRTFADWAAEGYAKQHPGGCVGEGGKLMSRQRTRRSDFQLKMPPSVWPQGPWKKDGRLTEVETAHWPGSIRELAMVEDERLPLSSRVDVPRFRAEAAE